VLLLERRRAEKNTLSASSNRDPQEVFDYFAGEIFTKSTEEAREILLLTSYFPRFTAEMANRLTETPNAGSFVDSLAQDHYFTTKHGADKPTYRYHALFREFLQSQANQVYTAERRHQVMVTAANLLRETHQFEDAVELLEQARDWPTLATVIEQCAPALAGQGRTNTLTEWLNSLPKELFPSRPWLCYWRGIARLAYQPPDARIDLERSFKSFSLSHDSPGVCLALAAILRSHVYEYQDFALIDPWLELVDKTNADFRSLDNVDIQANFIATVILAMLARRPDHTDLPMWIERAEAHVSKIPDPSRAMELLLFIGFYYYWRGDFRKGLTVAEAFRGLERSQQVGPMEQMSAMFLRARFEWQLNSVAKGTASLRKIKEIADLSGVHLLDGQLFAEFAVVSISVSDLTSAEHYLNSVNPVLTTFSNCDRFAYYLATACLELARGNLAAAVSYQEQALQAALKINMPMVVAIGRLLSASIIHKHGKCDEAREHVKLSLQSARQAEARFIEFMGLLTEAELAFDEDDHATGLTSLTKAMALGREHGYMNSFLWRPAAIAKLCAIALEADIEPEYVRRLIGEHRFPPPPSVAELEQWPWRIKVFTLGRFNVLVNDRPLEFGRKAQRKPIELLKLLVALGGRTVSELRVAEILWPEADGDMAQQSLSTTLHRLRRLLGSDDAIQRQSARLTINPRLCWVDAWALERLLSRAEE
ncbi:MAG: hypothetical protein OEN50_20665, partial [Deltaproteobacteria bacterium]|nr:hypothetical protein [Deltaproteobacteria bacterium]